MGKVRHYHRMSAESIKGVRQFSTSGSYFRALHFSTSIRSPGHGGRPPKFSLEEIALVVRLAKENIFFGLGKIMGEMKKLGIHTSASSVKAILKDHGIAPSPDHSESRLSTRSVAMERGKSSLPMSNHWLPVIFGPSRSTHCSAASTHTF